jgi:hypothetical protein
MFAGSRGSVRYSIYSGDPDGYFSIDPLTGSIRTASALDHEAHQSVLLNVQAMSGDPPAYGHTQVSGCGWLCVTYSTGVPTNFFSRGGGSNSVEDRGQTERGSGV